MLVANGRHPVRGAGGTLSGNEINWKGEGKCGPKRGSPQGESNINSRPDAERIHRLGTRGETDQHIIEIITWVFAAQREQRLVGPARARRQARENCGHSTKRLNPGPAASKKDGQQTVRQAGGQILFPIKKPSSKTGGKVEVRPRELGGQ